MEKNQLMIQSVFVMIVLSFIYLVQDSSATYIAAAKVGTCSYRKKAYGIIKMRKFECQKMGGRWNGRPGQRSWTDCHLDWCQIPRGRKRGIARGKAWYVCPAWKQRARSGRVYGIIRMKRHECDILNGKFNGKPGPTAWTNCHLYFCAANGYNKRRIWGVIPGTAGQCKRNQIRLAYGIIRMQKNQCQSIGGKWNGKPRENPWLNCHLDMCISENL